MIFTRDHRRSSTLYVGASLFLATLLSAMSGQQIVAGPDLTLIASNVSRAPVEQLVPICARAAGVSVQARYANNPAVAQAIADGARFDVVVVETHMLADLSARGFVTPSSMVPLAALRMAIATREPGPDPRTDTVPAFRRAMLRARSVAYAGDGHSGEVFLAVLSRLALRDRLADRLIAFTGGYPGAARAGEHAQYVVAPFAKPLPPPLRVAGYFPASLGADVDVSAGASRSAPSGAGVFIDCLRSPRARTVFTTMGYRLDR